MSGIEYQEIFLIVLYPAILFLCREKRIFQTRDNISMHHRATVSD